MIIKDNMANMCAKVTSTYMEFTLAFGPKPEFSFSFKYNFERNSFFISIKTDVLILFEFKHHLLSNIDFYSHYYEKEFRVI